MKTWKNIFPFIYIRRWWRVLYSLDSRFKLFFTASFGYPLSSVTLLLILQNKICQAICEWLVQPTQNSFTIKPLFGIRGCFQKIFFQKFGIQDFTLPKNIWYEYQQYCLNYRYLCMHGCGCCTRCLFISIYVRY